MAELGKILYTPFANDLKIHYLFANQKKMKVSPQDPEIISRKILELK
jgi:hypothetical protein